MIPLWKFFLQKKQFTTLLIIASVITGFAGMFLIPKESAPEIKIALGIVTTVFPGASSENIETLVTNPLEAGLANVPKLDKITSSSRENVSVISVQFTADADIDKSIAELKDAVDKAKSELPDGAEDPEVSEVNFADQPILIFSLSSDLAPQQFTALARTVKDELKGVSGVGKVEIAGDRKREVQVVVSKEKLADYGLSLLDVIGAIRSANTALPVGTITTAGVDYNVGFVGDLKDPKELMEVPLSTPARQVIYLRDVALISDGVEKSSSLSRISVDKAPSEQALTFNVYKTSGSNILKVASGVEEKIEELKSGILGGSQTLTIYSEGDQIRKDISNLTKTGIETMILVALVLFLTIGWKEALIASISVPLSFLIAFFGLYTSGKTINFMTLFSLILSIGILVDIGIVVIEAIHSRLEKYKNIEDAAMASIEEYAWPLIAGTFTTIAVFVPLLNLSGIVGKFVATIPYTIILVLIASIFVALGFLPYLATRFMKGGQHEHTETERFQEEISERSKEWYKNFLRKFLGHERTEKWFLRGVTFLFILGLLLPITGLVEAIFFGQDDQDFILIDIEKAEGTPLEETDITTRKVEEVLYTEPAIKSFATTIGRSNSFTGGAGGAISVGAKFSNIVAKLDKESSLSSTEVVEVVRKALLPIKEAKITVLQINNGPPSSAPVSIQFLGDDFGSLETAANNAQDILSRIPGTKDISASTDNASTEFSFSIDRAKAAEYGVSAQLVAQTLRAAVNGLTATVIKNKDDDIDVVVKLALDPGFTDATKTTNTSPDTIRNIQIPTPRGNVALGNFLSLALTRNTKVIAHEDRTRQVTVSAYTTEGGNASKITKELTDTLATQGLPNGVTLKAGGETEDIQNSFRDMLLAFLIGMILMLAILVLEFNSFRYAFYLLRIVPLSLAGVFFGLFFSGQPLGFTSMLGVIALGGVIINHAIILMDSYRRFEERDNAQHDLKEIVIEASATRFRPIILTTITTVLGMIPLSFSSALWGPFAFAIMFGLSYSLLLTLVYIPVLYYRHRTKVSRT
jgi:HAE1 family hydrophobic/amphiphilic exporter-1